MVSQVYDEMCGGILSPLLKNGGSDKSRGLSNQKGSQASQAKQRGSYFSAMQSQLHPSGRRATSTHPKIDILSATSFCPLGKFFNNTGGIFQQESGYYNIIHPSAIDPVTMHLETFAEVALGDELVLMASTAEELQVSCVASRHVTV